MKVHSRLLATGRVIAVLAAAFGTTATSVSAEPRCSASVTQNYLKLAIRYDGLVLFDTEEATYWYEKGNTGLYDYWIGVALSDFNQAAYYRGLYQDCMGG